MIRCLINTGHIGYVIIALTLLEIGGLAAYRRSTGNGPTLAAILPNILAGDFILLAWPLSAIHWTWSAACLLGALTAHSTDMLRRWQSA
jgi:hypothetical protein